MFVERWSFDDEQAIVDAKGNEIFEGSWIRCSPRVRAS